MNITGLDHIVFTVRDMERTCDFYRRILGMTVVTFGEDRRALTFGNQKINLHQAGDEITPNARAAGPGTADVCFVTDTPIDDVLATLAEFLVEIEMGPMPQTGARGAMTSIYFRDPDENLIEIARYDDG
jgi:catechol 2,3-dioxygenase-like lactoylglutathione lyase family enzyme